MKKFLIIFGLVLGFAGAVNGSCCGGTCLDYPMEMGWGCDYSGYSCSYTLTDNYVNGSLVGKTCCKTYADGSEKFSNGDWGESAGYMIAGAVNGSCCGGFTSSVGGDADYLIKEGTYSSSYSILHNGISFCAVSENDTVVYHNPDSGTKTYSSYYPNPHEYCHTIDGTATCVTFYGDGNPSDNFSCTETNAETCISGSDEEERNGCCPGCWYIYYDGECV